VSCRASRGAAAAALRFPFIRNNDADAPLDLVCFGLRTEYRLLAGNLASAAARAATGAAAVGFTAPRGGSCGGVGGGGAAGFVADVAAFGAAGGGLETASLNA
jgi:hypothetical protein